MTRTAQTHQVGRVFETPALNQSCYGVRVESKVMRLVKIFGNSRKLKVESRIVLTVENLPKIMATFRVQNFAKMYWNF